MMGGKKNIRMIVTDLDGTLVNAAYEITEENKKAVQAAEEIGVPTVIATGRMHSSAVQYAEALGVDAPIISYNGAIVKTAGGELLASSYLEPQVVERVLGFVFAQGWYVQSYVGDKLYYVEKTEAARVYETASKVYGEAIGRGRRKCPNFWWPCPRRKLPPSSKRFGINSGTRRTSCSPAPTILKSCVPAYRKRARCWPSPKSAASAPTKS